MSRLSYFFWPLRFYAECQHDCWRYHHRPYLLLWSILPVQHVGTPQGPAVAIPDPLLASDILPDAEVPEIVFR